MAHRPCWNCRQPAANVMTREGSDSLPACDNCTRIDREQAEKTGWTITPTGAAHQTTHTSINRKENQMTATADDGYDTCPPAPPQSQRPRIPLTQRGTLNCGERLRSPHGAWTVAESWIADKPGAQGKDRRHGAFSVRGDYHMYYLLTHDDGHQEEWSAPDMADFHRILPDEQQTLT